jgi:predicted flap endonuclease-1-like 5' DNA nuclease
MTKIENIEGIGESYAAKLRDSGVHSVEDLLTQGGSPAGRTDLARKSGINPKLVLRWVNHADLFRVKGVASEMAELLEAAGVDSVIELSHRLAENLQQKMATMNAEKHVVRQVPTAPHVQNWIEQAKTLPRAVTY